MIKPTPKSLHILHNLAAKIASKAGQGWRGQFQRLVAGSLYGLASLGNDAESMYDLGFMIWQRELSLIPSESGRRLIEAAARKGYQPAIDLAEVFRLES